MTDASSGKVPVVDCVVAAWRFLFDNWLRFLPAALVISVVSAVAPLLLGFLGGSQAPAAVLLGAILTAIAGVFFMAVVLRYAVRGEYRGPAGLGFGPDETSLIGVLAGMSLLFLPPLVLLLIVWGISIISSLGMTPEELEAKMADPAAFNQIMTEAMVRPPGPLVQIIGVVVFALLLYLLTRLVMVNAATIGERKVVFFQTWNWSKGNVTRIFAALFLTVLPTTLLNLVIASMLSGVVIAEGNPAGSAIYLVIVTAVSLIATMGSVPQIALGAHLYKGLRPQDFVAK